MLKFLLLSLLALAATTRATNSGYNYHGSESQTVHHSAPQQHVEEQFYSFNAPEEHVNHSPLVVKKIAPQIVKKYLQQQVIFIKPPVQQHYSRPVQNIVHHNTVEETKTHIYVLTPEHTQHAAPTQQVQHIQQATVHHHKPEVHHLTYHTPAEAEHLQHTIIQQYGGKPSDLVHIPASPAVHRQHHVNSASVSREYLAPAAPSATISAPVVDHHVSSASINRQYLAPLAPSATISAPVVGHHVNSASINRQYLAPLAPSATISAPVVDHHVNSASINRQYLAPLATSATISAPVVDHHVNSASINRQYLAPLAPSATISAPVVDLPGNSYIPPV